MKLIKQRNILNFYYLWDITGTWQLIVFRACVHLMQINYTHVTIHTTHSYPFFLSRSLTHARTHNIKQHPSNILAFLNTVWHIWTQYYGNSKTLILNQAIVIKTYWSLAHQQLDNKLRCQYDTMVPIWTRMLISKVIRYNHVPHECDSPLILDSGEWDW